MAMDAKREVQRVDPTARIVQRADHTWSVQYHKDGQLMHTSGGNAPRWQWVEAQRDLMANGKEDTDMFEVLHDTSESRPPQLDRQTATDLDETLQYVLQNRSPRKFLAALVNAGFAQVGDAIARKDHLSAKLWKELVLNVEALRREFPGED